MPAPRGALAGPRFIGIEAKDEFLHYECTFEEDFCGLRPYGTLQRINRKVAEGHGTQKGTSEKTGFGARNSGGFLLHNAHN